MVLRRLCFYAGCSKTDIELTLNRTVSDSLCLQAYSGALDEASGKFMMSYELKGSQSKLAPLCHTVGQMPFVTSWATGCAWPRGPTASVDMSPKGSTASVDTPAYL